MGSRKLGSNSNSRNVARLRGSSEGGLSRDVGDVHRGAGCGARFIWRPNGALWACEARALHGAVVEPLGVFPGHMTW